MSVEICTSFGKFFCKSAKAASSFSVSSMVPVFGCLVTVMSTAGFPFSEASPNLGCCDPIRTSATSSKVMGAPSGVVLMTARPNLRTSSVEMTPRTMYSFPYS